MEFEYNDSDRAKEVTQRARELMEEVVLPMDRERHGGAVSDDMIEELREAGREYGVYAPQIAEKWGGMGMDWRDALPIYEEAGKSLLGAPAMRVDAPDQGNMDLIELVGTEEQKEEWLVPLVDGEIRSAFSMTEPAPGGGSDPKMIKTTAEKDGDEWVINGHKWWTSQGREADVLLVMARTDQDAHPYSGCSFFLVPTDADGVNFVREIPHVGEGGMHGHSEVRYENLRVHEDDLLGEENGGFRHAQERLGPARLTHCMRYSGMAQRAVNVAKTYTSERDAFGGPLAEKQAIRFDIAEAETRLHAVRCMVRHAADRLASGDEARIEVPMCKIFAANTVQDIIDTSLQYLGGNGIAKDLPVAEFYEKVRPFRIVDGADEVHKRVIAREAFADENLHPEELEPITQF